LPGLAPAKKYSVWSTEGLPSTFGAGSWWGSGRANGPSGQAGGLWPGGPAGQQWAVVALEWQPTCSFSVLWHGEAFHGLGVQGAEVPGLPCALPQPSVSLVSQQGP
jgi:hypothetical protein